MPTITQTIPSITGYTGTIPDKATQTKTDFANSVNPYLNYVNNTFIPSYETVKTSLNTFATQANALATAVNSDASNASAAATSALLTANAVAWVSGTTYAINDNAISQIDFQTYRRIIAGAGTTDPSADPTNWVKLGFNGGAVTSEINAQAGVNSTKYTETVHALSSGVIDWSVASDFTITPSTTTTFSFTNIPTTGTKDIKTLAITNGATQTINWPTINWENPDGTHTTSFATYLTNNTGRTALQTSGIDEFIFWCRDGSTVYGKLI